MTQPAQQQTRQPGRETMMQPPPQSYMQDYKSAGKLRGKVALISGGDSGIGRAVAIGFAKEGADIAILYLEEDEDAAITREHIEQVGAQALLIKGDIGDKALCVKTVEQVIDRFGQLDILVNNAGEQHVESDFEHISESQIRRTFETNIFGMMFLTQAALPHLKKVKGNIINTTSITAYKGMPVLMDYASTKGAIVAFTRSLAANLIDDGVRVNAVAPGPIWTALQPASFSAEQVHTLGDSSPMGRPGQPDEVAPSYIFLASNDASYMSGQTLHPNGGTVVGG